MPRRTRNIVHICKIDGQNKPVLVENATMFGEHIGMYYNHVSCAWVLIHVPSSIQITKFSTRDMARDVAKEFASLNWNVSKLHRVSIATAKGAQDIISRYLGRELYINRKQLKRMCL